MDTSTTAKDRIQEIAQEYAGTVKGFARQVGATPQNLYDIIRGQTKQISPALADKIVKACPALSRSWLLTGEGPKYTQIQEGGGVNIQESRLDNSTVNDGGFITALLKELDAQRAITQKCLAQIDKSQAQIDRLITLLEAERGRK